MGTHSIRLYKEVGKKYTSCNLKTTELLDCALIGVCAVIRSNTVIMLEYLTGWRWKGFMVWLESLATHSTHSEDSDQPGRMRRLIKSLRLAPGNKIILACCKTVDSCLSGWTWLGYDVWLLSLAVNVAYRKPIAVVLWRPAKTDPRRLIRSPLGVMQ